MSDSSFDASKNFYIKIKGSPEEERAKEYGRQILLVLEMDIYAAQKAGQFEDKTAQQRWELIVTFAKENARGIMLLLEQNEFDEKEFDVVSKGMSDTLRELRKRMEQKDWGLVIKAMLDKNKN